MSNFPQRRRSFHNYRVKAVGTLTAAMIFTMLSVPVVGAASSFSSGSAAASAEAPSSSSSGVVDPAKVKVTEEEAVAKLRALFPVLKDAQMSGASLTDGRNSGQMENGDPVWQISWSIQRGNSSHGFSSDVNAVTGDLLNMGMPYELLSEPSFYPPKVSKKQAVELARKFIAQAVSSLDSQTLQESNFNKEWALTPLFGPVQYSFTFQASHEGVKVQGQSAQVTVSGNGNVTNFYYSNNSSAYPSSKPKVTLAEAKKKWEQDLQLKLAYVPDGYQWDRAPEHWNLVYVPALPLKMLDAQTGQWTDESNKVADASKPDEFVSIQATGEPYKAHSVTAEEAIKSIEAIADIPEEYSIQSKQLNKGRNGANDTWHLRWGKDNNSFYDGRSAQVDAETGQLLSFYTDRYGPAGEQEIEAPAPALPKDKAIEIADKWVHGNIPDAASYKRLDSSATTMTDPDTGYVSLTYQRFYRDLMMQSRTVTLTLNNEGRLVGMYAPAGIGSTESLDKLVAKLTAEEAKNKVLAATDMELAYVRSGGYNIGPSGKYIPVTMTLAYLPTDLEYGESFYRAVNAVSGELVSPYGISNGLTAGTNPADIDSHWARTALQAAVEHGVLTPDKEGKVYPNKTIATGEFIRMVSLAMNPYNERNTYDYGSVEKPFADVDDKSPYYRAVNHWIGAGWLTANENTKLNLDAALTRDQLAAYLAKITGYEKLAARLGKEASSLTQLRDADSITEPGAVELGLKLGLMNTKDGAFRPQGKVTVADAAAILLRLAQIQGELDRPLMR